MRTYDQWLPQYLRGTAGAPSRISPNPVGVDNIRSEFNDRPRQTGKKTETASPGNKRSYVKFRSVIDGYEFIISAEDPHRIPSRHKLPAMRGNNFGNPPRKPGKILHDYCDSHKVIHEFNASHNRSTFL